MIKRVKHIFREENFLSLAGNLVTALFGIAGFALLVRTLEVDAFGQWVIFISAGSFIEMFRFGITNTGLIRFLSGAEKEVREQLIGSNALIGLISTAGISVILILCNILFTHSIEASGYHLFFLWYPLLAFLNLPWNNALVVLQADRAYGKILLLKSINSIVFFLVLLLNFYFLKLDLTEIIWCQLAINTVTSLICMLARWDGLMQLRKASKHTNRQLFHFGKYTTFTLIGTNLLRSADTIIISLSPLGSAAVALYSIPLKLTELQQIPLRSFTATAFPKMSKASLQGKMEEVRGFFYDYSGAITYLFVLVSAGTFLFADWFVWALAGQQYMGTDPVTGFNAANIVRVFSFYGLLLPIDRMTGIGLDSINKPQINAIKVLFMVVANVVGDIIAVFLFKSLIMVAIGSILFTIVGIFTGMYFLNKEIKLEYKEIFIRGIAFYKMLFRKVLGNKEIIVQ